MLISRLNTAAATKCAAAIGKRVRTALFGSSRPSELHGRLTGRAKAIGAMRQRCVKRNGIPLASRSGSKMHVSYRSSNAA